MKLHITKHGDIRYVKRFALFPIRIDDEGYWLEVVYIAQKYDDGRWCTFPGWRDVLFASKEDYLDYRKRSKEKNRV